MTRPMPEHGTRARYLRGCHCPNCTAAHSRYCKRHKYIAHVSGPVLIDVAPAAAHLRKLDAEGWAEEQIATAADIAKRSVRKILHDGQQKITPENARKILAADPGSMGLRRAKLLPAIGFVRRGRALVAFQRASQDIAAAISMNPVQFSRILSISPNTITAEYAFQMVDVYRVWSTRPGTCKRSGTTAAARGWLPPAAWDDDTIDDPAAEPYAELHLSRAEEAAERLNEVLLLADAGVLKPEIAARVGLSLCRVDELLREHRPVLVRQIKALADAERGNQQRRKAA